MIPKIIHYCWFGGKPLPESAIKCINSWKKFLPEYEIKEWNESNFDVNSIKYTKEAYENKKYAFVSDYARFVIIYQYGGIYFDTDVEVIKRMDSILSNEGGYFGIESDANTGYKNAWDTSPSITVAPGLGFAAPQYSPFIKTMIEYYKTLDFLLPSGKINTTTIVTYTTKIFVESGLKAIPGIQHVAGFNIYPSEYFAPKRNPKDPDKFIITDNTVSIHHYMGSWVSKHFILKCKITQIIETIFPKSIVIKIRQIFRKLTGKDK